ncbi:MAG: TerC/Alx family metal homeostasis membrane protein [Patescibacteria group bacterium]|nr:TerC/Alx family metal homeostasis membrane protein [Patescibacteria group bacterium]
MISISQIFWILFGIFILGAVWFDLYRLAKRKEALSLKQAGLWTLSWIILALFFNLLIYFFLGSEKALEYLTVYLLEKSLSLDNLFVFLIIFSYFDLAFLSQQKVLKWGILGAFLMRAVFIFGGIWLLKTFHFMVYIFGGFLIFSGIKLFLRKKEKIDPQKNLFLKMARKIIPLTVTPKENKFFLRKGKFGYFTPLFLAMILIESSDLVFATDSVPAVLSITRDPFIAYTSNTFAILGLRALYFFLANFLPKFIYLKEGITILLIFIGLKMILSPFYHLPIIFSLSFIFLVLLTSILFSLRKKSALNF